MLISKAQIEEPQDALGPAPFLSSSVPHPPAWGGSSGAGGWKGQEWTHGGGEVQDS